MKFYYLFIYTTLFSFQVLAQKPDFSCSAFKSNRIKAKSGSLSPAQIRKTENYDVKYYKLDLSMSNLTTDISGTVDMKALARTNLDTVVYELYQDMNISSVMLNGNNVPFSRSVSAIKVPVNIQNGAMFTISTSYSGTPPNAATNPLGGSGLTNASSPTWGNQVTWSLSQPYSAYEWWPCKQSLRDKIDSIDVHITVPSNCKAGSNGLLKNVVNLGNGKSRYEWKHRHPIVHYLISVAVAQYIEYNVYAHPAGTSDSILIQNFIYNNPATLQNFKADLDETADFMEYFSTIYGPYPFTGEKYGHCMAPLGGGMEHQTMTTQGSFNKGLTAHELAHQWYGNHVTCGSWADIWVNEGFATYSEYLMLAALYPGEEVAEMAGNHSQVLQQNNGAVWVEDSLNDGRLFSGRLTYAKGAAILHTFRFIINNDSAFFRALKKYQVRFADSTALGTDVQKILEEESGLDLSTAFEQWYFGQGHPTYSSRWNIVNGNLHLRITHSTSAPGITPTFTNPLEIRFTRTGKPDTTIRFEISSRSNTFIINGLGNISSIQSLDPKNWIVNRSGLTSKDPSLVVTANSEIIESKIWTIFPNPTQNKATIMAAKPGKYILKILDTRGRFIEERVFENKSSLDIEKWQSGIYILKLESMDGEIETIKLLRKD